MDLMILVGLIVVIWAERAFRAVGMVAICGHFQEKL